MATTRTVKNIREDIAKVKKRKKGLGKSSGRWPAKLSLPKAKAGLKS